MEKIRDAKEKNRDSVDSFPVINHWTPLACERVLLRILRYSANYEEHLMSRLITRPTI